MDQAVGMMDEGYFVSRGDILKWVNNLLQLNVTKIEMLGSGAVYCQLMDIIYPGHIAMNKVNWKAKLEYEFIGNWKILQQAFTKLKIGRMIEVEKLCKAKYQDNLEFAQWMKRFFEMKIGDKSKEYDAVARRGETEVDFSFAEKVVVPKIFNLATQQTQGTAEPQPEKKRKSNNNITSAYSKESLMVEKKPSSLPMSNKENVRNSNNKAKSSSELDRVKEILLKSNLSDSDKVRELTSLLGLNASLEKPSMLNNESEPTNMNQMEEEEVL